MPHLELQHADIKLAKASRIADDLEPRDPGASPAIFFLHYWGTGPADKLARGFKAAVDQLGTPKTTATKR